MSSVHSQNTGANTQKNIRHRLGTRKVRGLVGETGHGLKLNLLR